MNLGKMLSSMIKPELDELREICNFTEEEQMVFNELSKGKSRVQIAEKLSVSCNTVSNRAKSILNKISKVKEGLCGKSQ